VTPLGSLRFRIVAAFLAAMTFMLSALVFLIVQYQGVDRTQALVNDAYHPLNNRVDQLEVDRQRIETDIGRLLRGDRRPATGESSPASIYSERFRQTLSETRILLQTVRRMAAEPEEKAVVSKALTHVTRIDDVFKGWHGRAQSFVKLSEQGNAAGAQALAEPLLQDARTLREEIAQLTMLVEGRIGALTEQARRKRQSANQIAFGLTSVALLLSFGLILAVLYALAPIGRLTAEVQRLAAGDYSGRVDVRGGDEIAVLASEFNAMVRALQLRDRTLVERAEQLNRLSRYLGSVLDSLEDGLLVVESGVVTLANPAAKRLWGVDQDAEPPPVVREWIAAPGFHERHDRGLEHEVRVVPFGDNGVIVVTNDVTEQRRALDKLARSERLALIGQMLAQITHEVRNPLNAMSLNAELLTDELGALDPDKRTEAWDLLGTVSQEIDRLTDVTGHYLQLARRPPARLAPEDLTGLLQDVARLLTADLERQGVALRLACEDLPAQLVDGNQLRQALLNVVRNAAEAGARNLELRLSREQGEVRIALADDGPGMSDEEVDRAFDPFFSTKASGTGLGLAITRQILEDHDGRIRVDSAPGHGATVTLVLPWRPAPQDSLAAALE
jgi:nitrogen fixation/metabolism regulation signal transduction histidine kinase